MRVWVVSSAILVAVCILFSTMPITVSGSSVSVVGKENSWSSFIPDNDAIIDQKLHTSVDNGPGSIDISAAIKRIDVADETIVYIDTITTIDSRGDMGYTVYGPYEPGLLGQYAYEPTGVFTKDDLGDDDGAYVRMRKTSGEEIYINYFGLYYSTAYICTNGFLVLDYEEIPPTEWNSPYPTSFPNEAAPNSVIAPFWRDLEFSDTSSISYGIHDSSNFFWVSWNDMISKADQQVVTFAVYLYQWELPYPVPVTRTQEIVYHYRTCSWGPATTIGLEDISGARGCSFSVYDIPVDLGTDGKCFKLTPNLSNNYRIKDLQLCLGKSELDTNQYAIFKGIRDANPGGVNLDAYATNQRDDGHYVDPAVEVLADFAGRTIKLYDEYKWLRYGVPFIRTVPGLGEVLLVYDICKFGKNMLEALSPAYVEDPDEPNLPRAAATGHWDATASDDLTEFQPWTSTVYSQIEWFVDDIALDHTLRMWVSVNFTDSSGETHFLRTPVSGMDGGLEFSLKGTNALDDVIPGGRSPWLARTNPDGRRYNFQISSEAASPDGISYMVTTSGTTEADYDVMGWWRLSDNPVDDIEVNPSIDSNGLGKLIVSGHFMQVDDFVGEQEINRCVNLYVMRSPQDDRSYNGELNEVVWSAPVLYKTDPQGIWIENTRSAYVDADRVKIGIGRPQGPDPTRTVYAGWYGVEAYSVPSIPRNLFAQKMTDGVMLMWDSPSSTGGSEVIDYEVFRSTSPNVAPTFLATVSDPSERVFFDDSVFPGTTYYYSVTAVNNWGKSELSNEASAAFGEPEILFSDNFDDGTITDWTITTSGGGLVATTTEKCYSTPYSMKIYYKGTTNRARATSPLIECDFSKDYSIVLYYYVSSSVSDKEVVVVDDGRVKIRDLAGKLFVGSTLVGSISYNAWHKVEAIAHSSTMTFSILLDDVLKGASYPFDIGADKNTISMGGEVEPSRRSSGTAWWDSISVVGFRPDNPPTQPGAPTLTPGDMIDGSYDLTWTPSTDNDFTPVIGYDLYEYSYFTGFWTSLGSLIAENHYSVDYRAPGDYLYRVRAVDSAGYQSEWSVSDVCIVPWDMFIANGIADADESDLAVDAMGNYHIVWVDNRSGIPSVYYKKVDSTWNVVIEDTQISEGYESSRAPSIAVNSLGEIQVLWGERTSICRNVYTPTLGWCGVDTYAHFRGSDVEYPDIVADESNEFHGVLLRADVQGWESIYYRDPEGYLYRIFEINEDYYPDATYRLKSPKVCVGGSDGFDDTIHVAFSRGSAWPNEVIEANITYMKLENGVWSTPVKVGTISSFSQARNCSISADVYGNVHISYDQGLGGYCVAYCRSTDNGENWLGPSFVGPSTYHYNSNVMVGAAGEVYLVWLEYTTDGGDYEVFCYKSIDYGATWQSSYRLTNAEGFATSPEACFDPVAGRLGVVWNDDREGLDQVYFTAKCL